MSTLLRLPDGRGRGNVLVDPNAIVFIESVDSGTACNLRLSCGLFVCVALPMNRLVHALGILGIPVDDYSDLEDQDGRDES